jgi:integrase
MASTLRAHSIALSAAFRHAVDMGRAHANPVLGMRSKLPTPHEKPIPRLTPDEIERIYAAMPLNVRACVIVIGEAGLRRNEGLRLTWHDVEDFCRLSIPESKTHTPRIVTMTARAQQVVRELWENRPATPLHDAPRLFSFGSSHLNREFRAAADRAGFPDVTPHTLRHAVGTGLAEIGVPTRDIRDALGHKSIVTTERYMNRAPQTAIDRAMQQLGESRRQEPPKAGTSAG